MSIKKYFPMIAIFIIIIGIIALGVWYSDRNYPVKELAKLNIYSKEELNFLEREGFLDNIDSKNLSDNKKQVISLLKSSALIEQNLNSPDESFEVLATKLDKTTYQLAFKLENKSNQNKEFYLIPVSESSQTEFKEIKGRISGSITEVYNTPLAELYDVEEHKSELRPELAQAYDDIDNNGYTGKPIRLVLEANSTLLAQSKWEINRGRASDSLEPVYLLVYGSAAGVVDEFYKDISFEELEKVEKEIGIYRITYDEYSDVEIKDQDMPEVKLRKWGDETYIKITYPDFTSVNPKQDKGKMKWINGNKEVHFYPLEPREFKENGHTVKQLEDGGFEFEVILKEKPATNKIVLNIESKGLNFYYQPPLNQKQRKGLTCSETTCLDENNVIVEFRPENVVGSYAVYHKSKSGNYEALGGKNYKAGKAFHIYRPQIIDSNNWKVWGELHYDKNASTLTVTIPQAFIDNAVYPVSVDPDFGNEGVGGGLSLILDVTILYGQLATSEASAGVANSITAYIKEAFGATPNIMGYLFESDGTYMGKTAPYTMEIGKNGWQDFNFSAGPSIESLTAYYMALSASAVAYYFNNDGGGDIGVVSDSPYTYDSTDNATFETTADDQRYSIYTTYTPAAAPSIKFDGGVHFKGGTIFK